MNYVPTKHERLILENPVDPRVTRSAPPWRAVRKGTAWNRLVAVLKDSEFLAVALLCAIGLLVTVALTLAFPQFGEIAQSLQQFL